MVLTLNGRRWQLIRSGACGDCNCKPPPGARGEFWASQWLRRLQADSFGMAALRQMLSWELCGESVHWADDDHVIDRAAHLLASGIWHLHPIEAMLVGTQSAKEGDGDPDTAPTQDRPAQDSGAGAQKKKLTWVALRLVDGDKRAVAGERYRVVLPDGSTVEGATNSAGEAWFEEIHPGDCRISFPNLDAREWSA